MGITKNLFNSPFISHIQLNLNKILTHKGQRLYARDCTRGNLCHVFCALSKDILTIMFQ